MDIKPAFVINGLEFSETLRDLYSWDELESFDWPDGWRVPNMQELKMLYKREPTSHVSETYWADGISVRCMCFCYGFEEYYPRDSKHRVRLVRKAEPAVSQIITTDRGVVVLYEDGHWSYFDNKD